MYNSQSFSISKCQLIFFPHRNSRNVVVRVAPICSHDPILVQNWNIAELTELEILQHIHRGKQKPLDFFVPKLKVTPNCSDSSEGKYVGSHWDTLPMGIPHARLHQDEARLEKWDLLTLITSLALQPRINCVSPVCNGQTPSGTGRWVHQMDTRERGWLQEGAKRQPTCALG